MTIAVMVDALTTVRHMQASLRVFAFATGALMYYSGRGLLTRGR